MGIEEDLRRTFRRRVGSENPDTRSAWAAASRRLSAPPRSGHRWAVATVGMISVAGSVGLILLLSRGGATPPSQSSGTCAPVAHFRGHTYRSGNAAVHPVNSAPIGQMQVSGCTDLGEPGQPATSPWEDSVTVERLPGVPPRVAVIEQADLPTVIWVSGDEFKGPFPPRLARYFVPPTCRPNDEPLVLEGPWIGILGADGKTELDMLPPYDVMVFVTSTSSDHYLRADLTIRVPPSLGTPLTHDEATSTLRTGGPIHVEAVCSSHGYLATKVSLPG